MQETPRKLRLTNGIYICIIVHMRTSTSKKFIYNADPVAAERRRRNITQETIAKQIGYTRQQVNRAENGESASFVLLQRLCKALDVPLSEVIPDLSAVA